MKGLKIKVRRLQLFGCSLNFWRECVMYFDQEARCVTDYQLAIWRRRSTVFILHFAPSLRFTLSLQSAFYTQSAFYPWSAVCSSQSAVRSPQSAVRSPQSSVYTDRLRFGQNILCQPLILFRRRLAQLIVPWKSDSRLRKIVSRSSFSGLQWH